MKKFFTFFVISFVLSLMATAQTVMHRGAPQASPAKASHIEPEPGQAWWGYFQDDGTLGDLGTLAAETYDCAIYIPGDHTIVENTSIYAERLWLSRKANIGDVYIWLSDTLPAKAEEASICCERLDVTKGGIVDGAFSEAHKIPTTGLYAGYSLTITQIDSDDDRKPIQISSGVASKENGMWLKTSKSLKKWHDNLWLDEYDFSQAPWGNLAMQVLVGDHFYTNGCVVQSVGNAVVDINGETEVPLVIQNLGATSIVEFEYTVKVDGVESAPKLMEIYENPCTALYETGKYRITIPGYSHSGKTDCEVRIAKVNGLANECIKDGSDRKTIEVLTVAKPSPRKTVMECYVKTTDGLCPLAYVADKRLSEAYPDNFIGVMVHDLDPMMTYLLYNKCVVLPAPWPWGDVNRELMTHPYLGSQYYESLQPRTKFGILDDYNYSQQKVVEAKVSCNPYWADDSQFIIQTDVWTTFQYNDDKADYALAFELCENGMGGDDSSWQQQNTLILLNGTGVFDWDPEVNDTYVKGQQYMTMTYDDVLVDGDGVAYGVKNSVQAPIVEGETQHYTHKLNIAANTLIQNKDNLTLTVLLLDTRSGRVVNADRHPVVSKDEAAGIATATTAEPVEVARYAANGQRIHAPQSGVNVIVLSDGTTRKVIR